MRLDCQPHSFFPRGQWGFLFSDFWFLFSVMRVDIQAHSFFPGGQRGSSGWAGLLVCWHTTGNEYTTKINQYATEAINQVRGQTVCSFARQNTLQGCNMRWEWVGGVRLLILLLRILGIICQNELNRVYSFSGVRFHLKNISMFFYRPQIWC